MRDLCLILAGLCSSVSAQNAQGGPVTRPDIWDPLGEKTTPLPRGAGLAPGEHSVRIAPGRVIGREMRVHNLYWTPTRDPRDRGPEDRGPFQRDPLPPRNNVTIYAFLGIPYALAPVHTRRFKPPQKLNKFPGEDATIRALRFREACVQDTEARPSLWWGTPYEYETSEDCLFLNIYTPQVSKVSSQNYPVVVFFHGGAFQYGSANDWPGQVLSSKGLVVVTANYRLGPFGFLSLGEPGTGNYGLMDQRLVLEWVQDHIYEFSGNPARVTVVGHGAGAVSAGLHMLSPGSAGLFHGVAAMSGAEVSYHQVITKPGLAFNNTIKLGRQVGCTQTTAKEVWACILTRSTQDFVQGVASRDLIVEYNRYAFLPTVDGVVIPAAPAFLLRNSRVASPVPYLTGVNQNDGTETLLSDRTLREVGWMVDNAYIKDRILDFLIKRNFTTNRQALLETVAYMYTYYPEPWNNARARDEFIKFGSEAYYVAPVSLSAQLHSQSGSFVWMYVNNYNFSRSAARLEDRFLPNWAGACHECDLFLLFGFPWMKADRLPLHLRSVKWTDSDRNASEAFLTHFAQFARQGKPNWPFETLWENYAPNGRHFYLDFNYTSRQLLLNEQRLSEGPRLQAGVSQSGVPSLRPDWEAALLNDGRRLRKDYRYQRVAFWNDYIHKLANYFTTTLSPTIASMRRELVGYKAVMGAVIVLLGLTCVAVGALSYVLFDRRRGGAPRVPLSDSRAPITEYGQSFAGPPSYTADWPVGAPNAGTKV